MENPSGGGGEFEEVVVMDFGEGNSLYELESLKKQYEGQLDALRQELAMERQRRQGEDVEHSVQTQNQQITDELRESLGEEHREHFDEVLSSMKEAHRCEVDRLHQRHVDDVNLQVKAMRLTLEQIYTSQLELVQAELEQRRLQSLEELRHTLSKEYKENLNKVEADWSKRLEDLDQEHEQELHDSILEESVGTEKSKAEYISNIHKKLEQEHRKLLQQISEDVHKAVDIKRRTPKKKKKEALDHDQEDTDTESIRSMPVTEEEFQQLEMLDTVQDVRQTLENQREEIVQLRSMMLAEYEQLLAARTDSVTSQTQEVEKMQREMAELQKHYEQQVQSFQSKVEAQTEGEMRTRLSDEHSHEMEEMKKYYEKKLKDLEHSLAQYTEKEVTSKHAQKETSDTVTSSGEDLSESVISENDWITSPSQDVSSSDKIMQLESKLAEKEAAVEELKKKIKFDGNMEDLYMKYSESEQKCLELQEDLKLKCEELDEMMSRLTEKDKVIDMLVDGKQEMEEKCAKDMEESESKHSKEMKEMRSRLQEMQQELEASKEQERVLEEQYDEIQHQNREAMEALRQDLEHENQVEIGSIQSEFKVQLEIELKRQAADMTFDHEEQLKQLENDYEEKFTRLQEEFDQKLQNVEMKPATVSQSLLLTEKDVNGVEDTVSMETVTPVTSSPQTTTDTGKDTHPHSEHTKLPEVPSHAEDVTDSVDKPVEEIRCFDEVVKDLEACKDMYADSEDSQSQASTVVDVSGKDGGDKPQRQHDEILEEKSPTDSPRSGSEDETKLMNESEHSAISSTKPESGVDFEGSYSERTLELQSQESSMESEAVESLVKEISKAKEDTLLYLRAEYEQKITELDRRLRGATSENTEYESRIESLSEQLEDALSEKSSMEKKLTDMESNFKIKIQELESGFVSIDSEVKTPEQSTEDLSKNYQEQISQIRKEYEEKMDLLRQELLENFNAEKEEIEEQHRRALEEAEEKYDTLIDGVRSGDAPEVAELIRDRIDSELEMAKSLLQQEMEETLESEETRLKEQHDEELDKLHEDRENEIQQLRQQHEKDLDECQKMIESRFEDRINDLALQVEKLTQSRSASEVLLKGSDKESGGEVKVTEAEPSVGDLSAADDLERLKKQHQKEIEELKEDYESKLQAVLAGKTNEDSEASYLEDMRQKYAKEMSNLETRYEDKLKEQEEIYQNEIQKLMTKLEERVTSPELGVPRLPLDEMDADVEGIVSQQSSSEDQLSSVPTRSTPREDMDSQRSTERVEITETLLPPAQITVGQMSPRSEDRDSLKSEDLLVRFDSSGSDDLAIDDRPRARLGIATTDADMMFSSDDPGDEPIPREVAGELQSSQDPGLPPLWSTSSTGRIPDHESDRSTPPDMLQTKALADVLETMQPIMAYEASSEEFQSGEISPSHTLIRDMEEKESKIKELEEEIQMLKDRQNEDGQNIVKILHSDLDRLNSERNSVMNTNERLLQLLSDTMKTYMWVEDNIVKKLTRVVPEGERSLRSRSPTSPEQSAAEGGDPRDSGDVPQETSVLSNITDEGLDLSQRITESIFQGPELDSDGEEILADASQRLQSSVGRLLDMIEDTTRQLHDSKRTQEDLASTVSSGQQKSDCLATRCLELEDRMREELEAKEYLALELHKAEGLIEGYSTERENLEQQLEQIEEKKEALVLELETTRNKLQDLESVHHEAESLRQEIQRHQDLVQDTQPGDQTQVAKPSEAVVPPSGEALMLEIHRLNDEKRKTEEQMRRLQERYENRIREVEGAGEETEGHYFGLLEEKKAEIQDLRLQLDSVEKQLKFNRQFMDEQAVEREQEREEYAKEIEKWKKMISTKDKQVGAEQRLQREVDELTEQLQNHLDSRSEIVLQTEQLQRDLQDKQMTAEEMRALVSQYEQELEDRASSERLQSQKIESLELEVKQQRDLNEKLSEELKMVSETEEEEEDKEDDGKQTTSSTEKRRRRLLPSHISLQQEEELIHEKEALQKQLENQMIQMSALKNQLDEMRHRGNLGEDSQNATLQGQLERQSQTLEDKEKLLNELKQELEDKNQQLVTKDRQILQLSSQAPSSLPTVEMDLDNTVKQIQAENSDLKMKIKSLESNIDSTPLPVLSQNLLKEKNQEIDHLNDQIFDLKKELADARSGQELSSLRLEVARQSADLEKKQPDLQFLRASYASTYSADNSDVEIPGASSSFNEKTNLQQEIEDSFAYGAKELEELRGDIETYKETLQQKEEEITDLKSKLELITTTPGEQAYSEALQQKEVEITALTQELTDMETNFKSEIEQLKEDLLEKEQEIGSLKRDLAKPRESSPKSDDAGHLNEVIQEKEALIEQMTIQIDGLNSEVESLNDFQTKLSEDFDTVQNMLEDKEKEIDALTKELTEKSSLPPSQDTVLELEMEIAKLKKDLREKDNVIEEKAEEMYLLNEKLEQQMETSTLETSELEKKLEDKEQETKALLEEKSAEIKLKDETLAKMQVELDTVQEHLQIAENLQRKLEEAGLLGPDLLMKEKEEQISKLKSEIVVLNLEISNLKERLESSGNAETQVSKLQKEILDLKYQLEQADAKDEITQKLREEVSALRHELDVGEQAQELESLKEEVVSLRGEAKQTADMKESLRTRDEEVQKLTEEVVSLRREVKDTTDMEEALKTRDEDVQTLTEEVDSLRREVKQTTDMEEALKTRDEEVKTLTEEVDSLRREVKQTVDMGEALRTKDQELESLKEEIVNLRGEAKQKADMEEILRTRDEEIQKLTREAVNLRMEVKQTTDKEEALKTRNEEVQKLTERLELLSQKSEQEAEISSRSRETIASLRQKLSVASSEHDFYTTLDEMSIARQAMHEPDLREEINLMEKDLTRVHEDLVEAKQTAESLESRPDLTEAVQRKENEILLLREELAQLKEGTIQATFVTAEESRSPEVHSPDGEKDGGLVPVSPSKKPKSDVSAEPQEVIEEQILAVEIEKAEHLQVKAQLSGAIGTIQEKEEKLSQTTAQLLEREEQIQQLQGELQLLQQETDDKRHLQETKHQLQRVKQEMEILQQEKDQELWDVKQRLKEAVEFSEQQLHVVDDKEQENVTLKLEHQQVLSEKDKIIRSLKHQLQRSMEEKEDEVTNVKRMSDQNLNEKERVIRDLQEQVQKLLAAEEQSSGGGDAVTTVTNLQSELQEKDDAVKKLQLELEKSKMAVEEKAQELEAILEELQKSRTAQVHSEKEVQEKAEELELIYAELQKCKQSLKEKVEDLECKAGELEVKAREVAELGVTVPPSGREDSGETIPESVQKHIEQLQMELDNTKAALSDLQKNADKKEPPVLRLRFDSSEFNQHQEVREPHILGDDVDRLREELRQSASELELLRSTASMSAKDYVRKVMDLREELSQEHQRHITEMQERARQEADTTLAQQRIRYEDEMEHLRQCHTKDLAQKIGENTRELEKRHKAERNRLMAKHQQQLEMAQLREPLIGSQDASVVECRQRLQSEISKGEQLNNQALKCLEGATENGDTESIADSIVTDTSVDGNMSTRLQMLLKRLHKEGVQMLSLSELQYLSHHLTDNRVDKEADVEALHASWENEKQSLLSAIQTLKDLLSQTHKLRGLDKDYEEELFDLGSEISDWRGELLQAVGYVFSRERENLLAELRSHVLSHPSSDVTGILKMDEKIRNQEEHQRVALDQIFHADRQSLLAEIRDLRAHSNISSIRHQEERERLSDQLNEIEDQSNKRERQLKRQVQLLEYKLQQEKILEDDLRTSMECERERCSQLSGQLSREKNAGLDLHTNVSTLHIQIAKLKNALEREQSRFISVTAALEEEKGKNQSLSDSLESERQVMRTLKSELEEVKVKAEVRDKIESTIEHLQSQIAAERDQRVQAENARELDRVMVSNLQQNINLERKNTEALSAEFEVKVQQLTAALEIEKARSTDLITALERERDLCKNLRNNLEIERASLRESEDQEQALIQELQAELESERAKVNDFRNALEREKHRISGLTSAIDSERTAIKDELENERASNRQLKLDKDNLQLQKLEMKRLYEREQDQVARLKIEREKLRSEVKAIKDSENEHERRREGEKMNDRRKARKLERERDDLKIKLHEQQLENQRLSLKLLDMEEQLTLSREKELTAIRDFEQERLRNLHTDVFDRPQSTTSPRGVPKSHQDHWDVYKAQLQSMCQSLQYLMLQYKDRLARAQAVEGSPDLQRSLSELMTELKQVQMPLTFESQGDTNLLARPDPQTINSRVMQHNTELTNFVSRLTEEKTELRSTLARLEDEIWQYRQQGNTAQHNGDIVDGTNALLEERANWAKERLTLQLALNSAEKQNEQLTNDLMNEQERSAVSFTNGATEADRDKMQRLYGKYLRAESFRKALVYQKKYLLLLLGGFKDCEETTLALIAQMGVHPSPEDVNRYRPQRRPLTAFRSAARVVVAITRMKYLVHKWRRATRVGSPIHSGRVETRQAYMPSNGSFSPPRISGSPRVSIPPHASGSSRVSIPPHASGSPRVSIPPHASGSSRVSIPPHASASPHVSFGAVTRPHVTHSTSLPQYESGSSSPLSFNNTFNNVPSRYHNTPPTRETATSYLRSSVEPSSSGARRKILSSGYTPQSSPGRSENQVSLHDDYIKRLESLQHTLGSMSADSTRNRKHPRR